MNYHFSEKENYPKKFALNNTLLLWLIILHRIFLCLFQNAGFDLLNNHSSGFPSNFIIFSQIFSLLPRKKNIVFDTLSSTEAVIL